MKLLIERIPDEGEFLRFDDVGPWALAAASAGLEGEVTRLDGAIDVTREGKVVHVKGELFAEVTRPCDRCAQVGTWRLGGPLDLTYAPLSVVVGVDVDLEESDLDLGFYSDGSLDLDAVLEEHFALALPLRLTCDTPGLVHTEGSPCSPASDDIETRDSPVDPRFAVLKGLKLD